jgi:hypothetical protein
MFHPAAFHKRACLSYSCLLGDQHIVLILSAIDVFTLLFPVVVLTWVCVSCACDSEMALGTLQVDCCFLEGCPVDSFHVYAFCC